jgi:hypothetical protein
MRKHTFLRNLVFLTATGIAAAPLLNAGDKFEVRLLGGVAFGEAVMHSPSPTVGAEFTYRFNGVLSALVGYQHIGADFCFEHDCAKARRSRRINDETILGARLSVPNRSRITPSFMVGVGSVRHAYPPSFSSHADDAATIGAGIAVRLTPRFGIATEVRRVAPVFVVGGSYNRMASGVYFRF